MEIYRVQADCLDCDRSFTTTIREDRMNYTQVFCPYCGGDNCE